MIRPARAEDTDALAALEREAFSADAWSPSQIEAELAGPTRHVFVAEAGDDVIGYASIAVAGEVADVTRIVVAESARRRGVASDLLDALHRAAAGAGVERMLLEVADDNAAAQTFYAAHGYAEISRRRAYYADGGDALVLHRALG